MRAAFGGEFHGERIAREERGDAWVSDRSGPGAQVAQKPDPSRGGLDLRGVVLTATGLAIVFVSALPPHYAGLPEGMTTNLGFAFILSPPKVGSLVGLVQVPLLLAEVVIVSVLGAISWLWAGE